MKKFAKYTIVVSCLIALLASALYLQHLTRKKFQTSSKDDIYYLPPSSWIKFFSAGYNEAAADLIFAQTVLYFVRVSGDYMREFADKERVPISNHTVQYVQTVVELDPRFYKAYTYGSQFILFHEGLITENSANLAIQHLAKGVKEFPDNGACMFDLGFVYYWDKFNVLTDENAKKNTRQRGVRILQKASLMADAPMYASSLSTTLLRENGLEDMAVEHLKTLLLKETNPDVRHTLEVQLKRSLGERAQKEIDLANGTFLRWKRESPFLSFDLFVLLSPQTPLLDPSADGFFTEDEIFEIDDASE